MDSHLLRDDVEARQRGTPDCRLAEGRHRMGSLVETMIELLNG
jgi:hypothetical protein